MSDRKRLRCPGCSFTADCGSAEMLRWLQGVGMLRRAKEADRDLIEELFVQTAGRFSCPTCGRAGLIAEDADDESDEAWGMARRCARCGQPIPAARLEVLPGAKYCAACQGLVESSPEADAETPDYCPQCGSIMTLRAVRGGAARYAMNCPQCGRVS